MLSGPGQFRIPGNVFVSKIRENIGRVDERMLEGIVDQRRTLPPKGMILPLHFTRHDQIEKFDQGQRDLVLGIKGAGINRLVMNGNDSVLAVKERSDRARDPSEHGLRVGKDGDRSSALHDKVFSLIHGAHIGMVEKDERISPHPFKGKARVNELPFFPLTLGKCGNSGNKREDRESGQDNSSASVELLNGRCPPLKSCAYLKTYGSKLWNHSRT